MKNESVIDLLRSGEIQMTDDVLFMVEKIIDIFEHGLGSDNGVQFFELGMTTLGAWRELLYQPSTDTSDADQVIANILTGGKVE